MLAWGAGTLVGSTLLMLLVLAVRVPMRRWVGPQLAYLLWALPAVRLVLPPLPADMLEPLSLGGSVSGGAYVLLVGPTVASAAPDMPKLSWIGPALLAIWLAGAVTLLTVFAVRHVRYCRRLWAHGTTLRRLGSIRIVAADVEGPLAFGIFRRFIAVPREFAQLYSAGERSLALAHERAHHARGDLVANWVSLAVLAAHWWNPVAWFAIRAFREDQEMAADAQVLAERDPASRALYAHVLAKAAGVGALPACNLNARCNLKGRLMMIRQRPRSRGMLALGSVVLTLSAGTALVATAATAGTSGGANAKQAVTIGVKPDGQGSYALILGTTAVAPGARLPDDSTLPPDFAGPGGCDLKPTAKPFAMVIKGTGTTQTYTVMCASAPPAPVRATLAEGLVSLKTMRASVATQPASSSFPEAERVHALGAIDRSIGEVRAMLAALD
ncbi:MAG: M56 family metallopeptidase [Pseudomonadota bacterium]|nr:M56 family metallopeptidase [Pseudomonadota bacterium]